MQPSNEAHWQILTTRMRTFNMLFRSFRLPETNRSGRLIPDSLIREEREELEAYLRLAPRGKYAETVQKLIETISGVQLIG